MSKAQLVITAVVLEGRSKSEVARDYGMSRYWVQRLVKRYEAEGPAAYQARSRRPRHNCHAIDAAVEDAIIRLRKTLTKQGYDAGAATIAEHLTRDPAVTKVPAVATIWRVLSRRGFVVPQPQNAPGQPGNGFAPTNPTNSGRPTSPTGISPMAPALKSSTCSTTTPAWPSPATPDPPSPAPTSPASSPPRSPNGALRPQY